MLGLAYVGTQSLNLFSVALLTTVMIPGSAMAKFFNNLCVVQPITLPHLPFAQNACTAGHPICAKNDGDRYKTANLQQDRNLETEQEQPSNNDEMV